MKSQKNIILKKIIIALIPLVIAFAFYMRAASLYVISGLKDQNYNIGLQALLVFIILTIVNSILSEETTTSLKLNIPMIIIYIKFSLDLAQGIGTGAKGLSFWGSDHTSSNLIFYLLFLVSLLISVIFIIYQIAIRIRKKRDLNNTKSN